jgi:hypothetical protein
LISLKKRRRRKGEREREKEERGEKRGKKKGREWGKGERRKGTATAIHTRGPTIIEAFIKPQNCSEKDKRTRRRRERKNTTTNRN